MSIFLPRRAGLSNSNNPDIFQLKSEFSLVEEAVSALGLVVWSMVEFEADDVLSSATARFKNDAEVEQIVICLPDKDLAQLVSGSRIVCWDRRRDIFLAVNSAKSGRILGRRMINQRQE